MAGLVPAIHAAPPGGDERGGVDARDKPGHDRRVGNGKNNAGRAWMGIWPRLAPRSV